jgi:hypothetical protein
LRWRGPFFVFRRSLRRKVTAQRKGPGWAVARALLSLGRRCAMLDRLMRGATAGAIATFPMTAVMEMIHTARPRGERRPMPPEKVVHGILHRMSGGKEMGREGRIWWALGAHLGYGVATGALYGVLFGGSGGRERLGKAAAKGAAYGVGVWAGSYAGWLPLAGILPPAWRQPAGENGALVASHVVWGAVMGVVGEMMEEGVKGKS